MWEEIKQGTFLFERRRLLANELKTVTLQELIDFFDSFICHSDRRKKFSSHFLGTGAEVNKKLNEKDNHTIYTDIEGIVVSDAGRFKRSMPLLPVPMFDPSHLLVK